MFGPSERGAGFKIVLGIVIIFSIFNHVVREAVRTDAGAVLQNYDGFRLYLGSQIISAASICPATMQHNCELVLESVALIFGLVK